MRIVCPGGGEVGFLKSVDQICSGSDALHLKINFESKNFAIN